jgi:hypothetical protein
MTELIHAPRPPALRRGAHPSPSRLGRALLSAALLALWVALCAVTVACEDDQFSESGAAAIVVDPNVLTFEPIPIGQTARRSVEVRNEGRATLILPFDSYELDPPDADFIHSHMKVNAEEVESLAPGATAILDIGFVPTSTKPKSATLTLRSRNGGTAVIDLAPGRPLPRLQVEPSPIAFTFVTDGQTAEQEVTVSNVGSSDLTVTDIFYKPKNSFDFSIIRPLSVPTTFKPGERKNFGVLYTPTGDPRQPDEGEIIFVSNNLDQPNSQYPVEVKAGESVPLIEVEPVFVDFGAIANAANPEVRNVLVRNIGEMTLTVSSAYITFGSSDDFKYTGDTTFALEPLETKLVTVEYLPTDTGFDVGSLAFESNDPFNPAVLVQLNGRAAESTLVVAPTELDFGMVLINTTQPQTFSMTNEGDIDLVVETITPANFPATMTYEVEGGLTAPFLLTPGESKTATVRYAPTAAQPRTNATLDITSTANIDPNHQVKIGFEAVANGCPQGFVVAPASLNFGTIGRGQSAPLTFNVTNCGAVDIRINNIVRGSSFLLGTTPNEFQITSGNAPVTITPGQTHTVGITFTPRRAQLYSGSFILQTNFNGSTNSTVSVRGQGTAPPLASQDIHVELTWDTGGSSDVDMHFLEIPTGGLFCTQDCNWTNLQPDWGVIGDIADDAFLDQDDTTGYGPENVNMQTPTPGKRYRVVLHYYAADGSTNALVKLFHRGSLVQAFGPHRLSSTGETWDVFELEWPSRNLTTLTNPTPSVSGGSCRAWP